MNGEFDIDGVFAPGLLIWGLLAVAASLPLRWLLIRLGAYRFVWHRGLFDIALVVVLWACICAWAASLVPSP
jgi:hypothetical protein